MSIKTWHESALRAHWGIVVSFMDKLPSESSTHICDSILFFCSRLSHATISCKLSVGFDGYPKEVIPSNH